MLSLKDILQFLKKVDSDFDHYYIGRLNDKNDNSLGLYNLPTNKTQQIAIGGPTTTKTKSKYLSLLVHGNKNKTQTETLANDLYEKLASANGETIGNNEINYIKFLCDEPIDLDMDQNGVYEYSIEIQIFYNKNKE